jgi:hypothetical protein
MTSIVATAALYDRAQQHLRGTVEQVGFFLADLGEEERAFVLREWRPVPPEAFEFQGAYHVTLRDDVRPEIIRWAWDRDACLVEIHSHLDGVASFSSSDLFGLEGWVPHVRWRLEGRPYAAIVNAGETFDALAWLDGAMSQVEQLQVDDRTYPATARTLARLTKGREQRLDI